MGDGGGGGMDVRREGTGSELRGYWVDGSTGRIVCVGGLASALANGSFDAFFIVSYVLEEKVSISIPILIPFKF